MKPTIFSMKSTILGLFWTEHGYFGLNLAYFDAGPELSCPFPEFKKVVKGAAKLECVQLVDTGFLGAPC